MLRYILSLLFVFSFTSLCAFEDDDIYDNPQFLAELDRLEQRYSSQPQMTSHPSSSSTLFDGNQDPFDHGSCSSSDPRPETVPLNKKHMRADVKSQLSSPKRQRTPGLKQPKIDDYFTRISKSAQSATSLPKSKLLIPSSREKITAEKKLIHIPFSPHKLLASPQLTPTLSQGSCQPTQHSVSLPKPLPAAHSSTSKSSDSDMRVSFLHGTDDHIHAYSHCIDKAEEEIIIASWNVHFIPESIFSSLMGAKKRGVPISFIVNSVKRKATLDYFSDDEEDESTFALFETKSHAKFLFVDKKYLILGSFNALGEPFEENKDSSFKLKGSISQLWPFYMSIYETYTSLGEELGNVFDGIAMISRARYARERNLLQIKFKDNSRILLLRNSKEHEDFFKGATPYSGKITIYSPFSTKDNTLKRLQTLESILPPKTEVCLKVLEKFETSLTRLLSSVPNLKSHARIEVAASHQKVVVVGNDTICVGSLNWLSAAQDEKDPYRNVELSIVLQGPKAEGIIKSRYSH